jgi:hypothetical protein
MTYRKTEHCGLMCKLSQFIRRNHWKTIKRALSWQVQAAKYTGNTIHKAKGAY